jgi:hypothetical protein
MKSGACRQWQPLISAIMISVIRACIILSLGFKVEEIEIALFNRLSLNSLLINTSCVLYL